MASPSDHWCLRACVLLCACIIATSTPLRAQQIAINRVDLMPDLPSPYLMRDWKAVARGYDSLVYNGSLTGQYLPLIWPMVNTVNYPSHASYGLHTVVGTTAPSSSEAINVLPSIVSGSLVGIDKSTWAAKAEEYFNNRSAENVYLNHPVSTSGDDWWYETMPNVFFYQVYSFYPAAGDFPYQFTTVADRWQQAVTAMGGSTAPWQIPNMDHRAWALSTMTPNDQSVHEPEAAGAIAWILYNAYVQTGDRRYRTAAELSMEFLNSRTNNPAYELQLFYGTYIAARMNAEIGTSYDVQKLLNWCFDVGPLRNWGAMVGTWGVYDCSGLIGEVNNVNNYAFSMNTFEQVGALVPLTRYDPRFARAIGKWVLNAANAARLFYTNYLPAQNQDPASLAWAQQYDPQSYIAHEALRQSGPTGSPYATGDAVSGKWASTNLALYSSSHAGILGAIIDTTSVRGILRLDLLKTDYFHAPAFPSYLYYNPYSVDTSVTFLPDSLPCDLYDAVSKTFVKRGITGVTQVTVPANKALLLVATPVGGTISYSGASVLVNGRVIDYRGSFSPGNRAPRIKGLGANPSTIVMGSSTNLYCTAVDPDGDTLTYSWNVPSGSLAGSGPVVSWTSPLVRDTLELLCSVSDGRGGLDTGHVTVNVVDSAFAIPIITRIYAAPGKVDLGHESRLACAATDPKGNPLTYTWTWQTGSHIAKDSLLLWTAPLVPGNYTVSCMADNGKGGRATDSVRLEVRDLSITETGTLVAYYPFNGNANDESGNGHNGVVISAVLTADRWGRAGSAYYFNGSNANISVPAAGLNFDSSITVAFLMRPDQLFNREQFPISHGSWPNRWKVSIIPERKVRWTVMTAGGTVRDVDSKTLVTAGQYYHVVGVYNGADLELYIDGNIEAFTSLSGPIKKTTYDLTMGQSLPGETAYNFRGMLDDVRIYDYALSVPVITGLYQETTDIRSGPIQQMPSTTGIVGGYPNPFNPATTIDYTIGQEKDFSEGTPFRGGTVGGGDYGRNVLVRLTVYDILGRQVAVLINQPQAPGRYSVRFDGTGLASGVYICTMQTAAGRSSLRLMLLK